MNKDDYEKSLPPGVLEDMKIGGKTRSPMGDVGMLAATGAAVKGIPWAIGAGGNLLKNEVAKSTVTNLAHKKGMLPELTRSGIKNWQHMRPWNAFLPRTRFTPGGTLDTLPTPAAGVATGGALFGLGIKTAQQTNPLSIRDTVLDAIQTPEHYKRFIQYLTGGVQGDVVDKLPRNILLDVVGEHLRGAYPNRDKQIPNPNNPKGLSDLGPAWVPNPNYDPNSTLLSTYGSGYTGSKRTLGSLGHLDFSPQYDADNNLIGYRIKDKWDVDHDPNYKAWKSPHHADLIEGGIVAARANDLANKLGTAKGFNYDVFIPIAQFNELAEEIKSKSQFQRKLETSTRDKRPPHKIK